MNEEIDNSTPASSADIAAPRNEGQIANTLYGGVAAQPDPDTVEGYTAPVGMKMDAAMAREVRDLVAEMGLPEDAGQKIVDLGAKYAQHTAGKQAESMTAAVAEWERQARADPEFGGDRFNANLKAARGVLEHFGTPELRAVLNDTRLGSHPEVMRFMVRLHNAVDVPARVKVEERAAQKARMSVVR